MSKMQRHQQEALWEFVHTELTYINKLIIIRDLVMAALEKLQHKGFLLEVSPELLFSNLPSVLDAHQLFWQEVIYPLLQEVRRSGKPFDPLRLEAGCLQVRPLPAGVLRVTQYSQSN
ncbi:pleckstrin homology domain-containing family G member 6-like [Stegastes partitus]|uniref:Pleckstrin homology domain-containing family G member 6-like n=1 Tax=Stegastes partitus TaxID=144197 RepID=A0A9Y4NB02_9TELE|nr:PREDICTED: pleckstrin homology domain-containing family G member 6-like [Stegastes partitus]